MEDGRVRPEKEVRTRKMIGAGFAKKVSLFFGEHAARVKHGRHVEPKDDFPLGGVNGDHNTSAGSADDKSTDLILSAMEEGVKKEVALETALLGKVVFQDDEALKQLNNGNAKASKEEEEPKHVSNDVNSKSGKGARAVADEIIAVDDENLSNVENLSTTSDCNEFKRAVSGEITTADDVHEKPITASECNELKENAAVKLFIQQAVRDAIIKACEADDYSQIKGLISDLVKQAVEECHASEPSSTNNSILPVVIPPVDLMKLVKDAMAEHQTFSRVLYVLALGTPIILLIARALLDNDDDKCPDKTMIKNTALEMGFSFLAVTVCHLYIIIFHFVHTKAPRLSVLITRLIIVFLCLIVSSWILVYTFHMPEYLFRTYFWWITGVSLFLNWVLSGVVRCTGLLKEENIVEI